MKCLRFCKTHFSKKMRFYRFIFFPHIFFFNWYDLYSGASPKDTVTEILFHHFTSVLWDVSTHTDRKYCQLQNCTNANVSLFNYFNSKQNFVNCFIGSYVIFRIINTGLLSPHKLHLWKINAIFFTKHKESISKWVQVGVASWTNWGPETRGPATCVILGTDTICYLLHRPL